MTLAIEAVGLVKRFGKTVAVDGVDLAVRPGMVLGLLGPNGAGKTTVVRMLATLLGPDAGHARVCGADIVQQPDRVRELIGLTGQYAAVDEDLTGYENLLLIGRLLEMPKREAKRRSAELLERFDLADAAGRSVKTYSGGMRRRLDLAASLVQRPAVLFLDEPTTGLDPRSRGEVWAMIRALVAKGMTVLLTTQYLDEADRLASEIAVIDHGRVIATGTAAELKAKIGRQTLDVRPADPADLTRVAGLVEAAVGRAPVRTEEDPGLLSVAVDDAQVLPAVVSGLQAERVEVTELALRHALTLAWRALVRIRRNPEQLLDVTLQPIVFVTLFVFLFGGAIKGESRHTYLQYVLPGIMVMTVLFASIGTGVGLNTDVTKGIFDRFRSMPIARSAPLTGTIMGDFVRYVVSIAMVFAYGSLLGFRIATNAVSTLGAFGLMFVLGFAVGWIWVLLGLYVKSPQSLQGFSFIVMFPLAFGSNVFIQTSTLPGWLQAWVRVNPVTALAGASRGLMLGGPVATPAWHSIAWSIAITVVFAPLAVRRYRHIG